MSRSYFGFSQADFFSIWLDYNHSNKLKKKWFIVGDYGYRFRVSYDYNWQRVHARAGVGYTFDKLKVLGGVALFSVFDPNDFLDLEVRPWQGIKYVWKVNDKLKISNYPRLEERFHFFGANNGGGYNYFLICEFLEALPRGQAEKFEKRQVFHALWKSVFLRSE